MLNSYSTVNGGWYRENSGPLALRDASERKIGEHETRSIYRFTEGFGLYDLSLQLAVKSSDMPTFEFIQGDEVLTSQCYNAPHVADDGDNFIICPCYIMPLKQDDSCSLIVEIEGSVNFAYKLLGWNYATED
mmetsp:Transcript_15858/g.19972  ORF Transcript_15858/g.19972 Transcript_15858/m.19972 type:complete len:132 (+) Transcript_15858:1356-1751(+)|eukprot:CAMPEP_0170477252 /NCGR_PEP_ID=MMETSP0123-20130129/18571_1 /TAXON_ID=182087 /ORGANISM="Favella ehrenbergii, Strain Fehren 1" /LENGTH=131 /DNA_ID=CAMNT_0010748913 /DNA_START=132 /DNA_END=527 /DNA_ORIENTATION=-